MSTLIKTANSITVRIGENSISVLAKGATNIEFHQTLQGRDSNAASTVQKIIKDIILNKIDKRRSYSERIAKVASILNTIGNVETFSVLKNRLSKVEVK